MDTWILKEDVMSLIVPKEFNMRYNLMFFL
jgi:hypothetical protein